MRQLQSIHSSDAPTASTKAAASDAVRQALELLNRASGEWRNGTPDAPSPLHWPIAVSLARRALRQALSALEGAAAPVVDLADARAGMAWFNSLTPAERAHWLEIADSAVPADAWRAFQAGAPHP